MKQLNIFDVMIEQAQEERERKKEYKIQITEKAWQLCQREKEADNELKKIVLGWATDEHYEAYRLLFWYISIDHVLHVCENRERQTIRKEFEHTVTI